LISYDIRGPPVVDVLAQSAGVTIDVEAIVTKEKIRLGYGYRGNDGQAVPAAVAPLGLAQSDGDNSGFFLQDAFADSGDAISGSQRIGVTVEGDAAAIRVLAQNASPDATAVTGNSAAANNADGHAGPVADGSGTALAGSNGDNQIGVDQDATAHTGDAIAGSQVVDVKVTGSVGEVTVLAQNASPGATAISGNATATNTAVAAAGPSATTPDGAALAGQLGDNRVDATQSATAISGDALAGAQVIGVQVGGSAGEVNVMATNASDGAFAQSGDALATNFVDAAAGPSAVGLGFAASSQVGDNTVLLDQTAVALSGRAVAGSQVVGVTVGTGTGQVSVQPQNASDDAQAISGTATADNVATGTAGPQAASEGTAMAVQHGSNHADVSQVADGFSGDAIAGGQVVGVLEPLGRLS